MTIEFDGVNNIIKPSNDAMQIGVSGDTITKKIGATIANSGTATGFGGDNTPAWHAFLTSSQNMNSGAETVIVFDSEVVDSDSAYNTSNGKFTVPSGEGGKYFVLGQLMRNNFFGGRYITKINVEGSPVLFAEMRNSDSGGTTFDTVSAAGILNLSAGDEVTCSLFQNAGDGSGANGSSVSKSFFMGFKLIGV